MYHLLSKVSGTSLPHLHHPRAVLLSLLPRVHCGIQSPLKGMLYLPALRRHLRFLLRRPVHRRLLLAPRLHHLCLTTVITLPYLLHHHYQRNSGLFLVLQVCLRAHRHHLLYLQVVRRPLRHYLRLQELLHLLLCPLVEDRQLHLCRLDVAQRPPLLHRLLFQADEVLHLLHPYPNLLVTEATCWRRSEGQEELAAVA